MEELIKSYGLPTALLVATGVYISLLVSFLKELIKGKLENVLNNQGQLGKEMRAVQDDIARIELMLRLTNDLKTQGRYSVEMSRVGKSGTDVSDEQKK